MDWIESESDERVLFRSRERTLVKMMSDAADVGWRTLHIRIRPQQQKRELEEADCEDRRRKEGEDTRGDVNPLRENFQGRDQRPGRPPLSSHQNARKGKSEEERKMASQSPKSPKDHNIYICICTAAQRLLVPPSGRSAVCSIVQDAKKEKKGTKESIVSTTALHELVRKNNVLGGATLLHLLEVKDKVQQA